MDNLTFDKIFSYWIIVWLIVYIIAFYNQDQPGFDFVYENGNPFFLLVIGLIENILLLCFILFYNPKLSLILKFSIMFVLLKIIPLYILFYHSKIKVMENLVFSFSLFVFYNMYLWYKNTNIIEVYSFLNHSVIYDLKRTPLLGLISKITNL